jgi:hypothetical protein
MKRSMKNTVIVALSLSLMALASGTASSRQLDFDLRGLDTDAAFGESTLLGGGGPVKYFYRGYMPGDQFDPDEAVIANSVSECKDLFAMGQGETDGAGYLSGFASPIPNFNSSSSVSGKLQICYTDGTNFLALILDWTESYSGCIATICNETTFQARISESRRNYEITAAPEYHVSINGWGTGIIKFTSFPTIN